MVVMGHQKASVLSCQNLDDFGDVYTLVDERMLLMIGGSGLLGGRVFVEAEYKFDVLGAYIKSADGSSNWRLEWVDISFTISSVLWTVEATPLDTVVCKEGTSTTLFS
jgi:hypothetical protein